MDDGFSVITFFLSSDFNEIEMVRRAGIKRYRPARRVILLVAGGDRASTVKQNNSYVLVGFSIIALNLHIRFELNQLEPHS